MQKRHLLVPALAFLVFLLISGGVALAEPADKDLSDKQSMNVILSNGPLAKLSGSQYLRLGLEASLTGHNKLALKYLTQAIDSEQLAKRQLSNAYINRAMIYERLGNNKEAMIDLIRSMEIKPDNAYSFYQRGNVLTKMKRYRDAVVDYTWAIKLRPNYAEAYFQRGMVWYKTHDYKLAIKNFNQAVKINPMLAEAVFYRSQSYKHLGQYQKALDELVAYDLLRPLDPRVPALRKELEERVQLPQADKKADQDS